jgi:hypothetical protein
MLATYEKIKAYHQEHGDDYGTELSRECKYRAVRDLIPHRSDRTLLDVGCGAQKFRSFVPRMDYVGIDLVFGQNVMDETRHFDVVVCNGCVQDGSPGTSSWT